MEIKDVIAKHNHTERLVFHDWLKAHDKDYAFECAVMGKHETYAKYTMDQLWARCSRIPVTIKPLAHFDVKLP